MHRNYCFRRKQHSYAVCFTDFCCFLDWFVYVFKSHLLTFPSSGLAGLMSLHLGLLVKSGLWSFNVIKDTFWARHSSRGTQLSLQLVQIFWQLNIVDVKVSHGDSAVGLFEASIGSSSMTLKGDPCTVVLIIKF